MAGNDKAMAGKVALLGGVKVLVVGDAMLDHYIVGSVERISPEAPVPIVRVEHEFDRVGGAANVAANVATLGGAAELVCLAGRDHSEGRELYAEHLRQKCESFGINPSLLRFLPCTVRKSRVMAGRQQLLRIDREQPFGRTDEEHEEALRMGAPWEALPLPQTALAERQNVLAPMLKKCDVVLVSDYAKGMIDADVMKQLVGSGKPVIVDPRPQHADMYRNVTLVTPNRKEATEMLGLDSRRNLPGRDLGRRICEKFNCDALVTLGAEGMCLVTRRDEIVEIPTAAQEVFDVTGAGDTVAATIALAIGAGLSLPDSARLANAAAGLVVAHIGTAFVRPEELREALSR